MKYLIVNIGCHDDTYTEIELNEKEFEIIKKFGIENNKTGGGCCPVIEIYSKYELDQYGYWDYNYEDNLIKEK